MNLSDSAVVNNGEGAGIIFGQNVDMTITNSTFSGNAGSFGVVWARGESGTSMLTISNSTFADNQNTDAAVYYSATAFVVTNVVYDNTIFADNTSPNFLLGTATGTINVTSLGYNLLDDATGDATPAASDQLNTDPLLGALQQQAGTFVHAPLDGSTARDMGDPSAVAGVGGIPLFDQRGSGYGRVSNGRLDIGALEAHCIGFDDTLDCNSNGVSDCLEVPGVDTLFAADVLYGAGNETYSVATGDLDGDGDLDLAVANLFSDNVSVLLNNGDGTYAADVTYGVGNGAGSVAVGDLDGDMDLAVTNSSSDNVSVLLNIGDGTFAADVLYGASTGPSSVAAGDLDGDGDLDLAVANFFNNKVSVLLNNGDGTFANDVLYSVGSGPGSYSSGRPGRRR